MLISYVVMFREAYGKWVTCSCSFLFGCYPIFCVSCGQQEVGDAPGALYFPLEAEIADDWMVSASRVHRDYGLVMYDVRYSIDLVHIALRESKVIVGMDGLSRNGAMIDCELQLVRVRTQSRGELVIQGECAQHGLAIYSAAREMRYLHHAYSIFLAYVVDT